MQARTVRSGGWRRSIAAVSFLALCGATAAQAELLYAANAQPVAGDVAAALNGDSLVANLAMGESANLGGVDVRAREATRGLIALSTGYVTFAVTSGQVEAGGVMAKAGQALVIAREGGAVERRAYDAGRLLASASPGARARLADDLEAVDERQNRLRWFGYFEPTGINLAEGRRESPAPMAAPTLTARMLTLRQAMILNPADAMTLIDPMEQRELQSALGVIDAAHAGGISWFFRAASLHGGPTPDTIFFYNPLVDAALTIKAAFVEGEWRVLDAKLIDAAALRGPEAGYWAQAREDALKALADNQSLTMAALRARSADAPAPANSFQAVSERMRVIANATQTWRQDGASVAAAESVRQAIAAGDVAAQAPAGGVWRGREIDGLPQSVRTTMTVTAAAPRGAGTSLFLISPLAPDILVLVDMAGADPANLSVVNLANAAGAGANP